MPYLIGTDEAGYGPNLGPLVISTTLWQLPDGAGGRDLYDRLEGVVATRREVAERPDARIAIADSKTLYQPPAGLRHLERALWAVWGVLDQQPRTWLDIWRTLAADSLDDLLAIPWYAGYDPPAPFDADPAELKPLATVLDEGLAAAAVKLLALQSRAVFPGRFNELLANNHGKGSVLSHLTLDLVARTIESLEEGPVFVLCDKHGGRNRYARLLGEHFGDALIEIHEEGRRQSVYRFGPHERRVEIRFESKADSHLPAALASMASKYLRELAMRAFNAFWCDRIPALQPTAGYPQDAKRFRQDVATTQAELGIDDRIFWRNK